MARQSFVWTALPNGYAADTTALRLSVLLSPRLDPESTPKKLQSFFPDWADWPKTLTTARFEITYNGATVAIEATDTTGATRVDSGIGRPDSAVWKAIFHGDVPVRPFTFKDLSNNQILSYDTMGIANLVQRLYADLAARADDDLPRVSDIADDRLWSPIIAAIAAIDRASVDEDTGVRDPVKQLHSLAQPGIRNPEALSQLVSLFQLFHTPPATPTPRLHTRTDDSRIEAHWLEYRRTELPKKDDISKELDFHQIVAAMSSYPTLLRRLGLVVDVLIDANAFPPAANAALGVKVTFPASTLNVARTSDANPETRTVLTGTKFQAVSDPAAPFHLSDGLLQLDPTEFGLLQFDVDGAGLKLMNFARSLIQRRKPESRVDPITRQEDRLGVPSLRNAGLMLVHRRRWAYLRNRFQQNKTGNDNFEAQFQNAANNVHLHAEDLVRGYRIDIWDSLTGKWQSLCRRTAHYELDDGAVTADAVPEEETTVRLGATRSADHASNADVIYLHEALVAWIGWSLAAPPPGRAVLSDDTFDTTQTQTEAEIPPGLKFKSHFAPVRRSLPRLRFGRSYAIRARAVDLAGNSLKHQTGMFGPEQTHWVTNEYLRYEPIEAPVITLVGHDGAIEVPAEGESIACLAIRTFNDTPADNTIVTTQVSHRAAVPPRVSVRDAEHHGKLDGPGTLNAGTFNMLANEKDVDPRDPAAAVREATIPMKGPLDDHAVETTFAVYESARALTYLPDPVPREVAVRVFDHPHIADSEIISIPLYTGQSWPAAEPFTIELFDDPGATPYFDEAARCLRIPLPKGMRARARLSMKPPADALNTMGIFRLLNDNDRFTQRDRVLSGQHWMITPWREVDLVHAVQRPLLTPEINSLSVAPRRLNVTSARPVIHATCSINSTDRLDLLAEWHEPLDDPQVDGSANGPADRQRRDVAFQVKITDSKNYANRGTGGETGGFPDHTIIGDDAIAVNTEQGQPHKHATPLFNPKPHEFHDTRYRRIEYWFDATTKFREFLPASLLARTEGGQTSPTDTHIKVTGQRAVTWIPSSAPPPSPKVLYVVPTFGWARDTRDDGQISSWRQGGGLRIYLDRDWNSSGYGEMLGVVLPPAGFVGDPDNAPAGHPYKDLVTQWANDPVWDAAFVPPLAPRRTDFSLARTAPDPAGNWLPPNAPPTESDQRPGAFTVTALQVPSAGAGAPVEVAPHDVVFDPDRRLWFCDIEIKTTGYFPFIRLALARYQPIAVPAAHLSNVVLADIMSLTADRWLNVTPTDSPSTRHVAVYGPRPYESSGHSEAKKAKSLSLIGLTGEAESLVPAAITESTVVEVWIEQLDERLGEDFGWTRVAHTATTGGDPQSVGPGPDGVAFKAVEAAVSRQGQIRERLRVRAAVEGHAFNVVAGSAILDLITPWQTLWEGNVTLPYPKGRRNRLVIAEYEEYLVDDKYPYDKVPTSKGRRLVFVEHIELV